jgi:hypothetical protein
VSLRLVRLLYVTCPLCGVRLKFSTLRATHLAGVHGLTMRERSLVTAQVRPW